MAAAGYAWLLAAAFAAGGMIGAGLAWTADRMLHRRHARQIDRMLRDDARRMTIMDQARDHWADN